MESIYKKVLKILDKKPCSYQHSNILSKYKLLSFDSFQKFKTTCTRYKVLHGLAPAPFKWFYQTTSSQYCLHKATTRDDCKVPLTPKSPQMCVLYFSPERERQRSWFISTLVSVSASTHCTCIAFLLHRSSGDPELCAVDMQAFYFCQMMEHNTAIQHRADWAGQEVRHRYNIKALG